jgi:hypothetical protein
MPTVNLEERYRGQQAAPTTRATKPALWERPSGRDMCLASGAATIAASRPLPHRGGCSHTEHRLLPLLAPPGPLCGSALSGAICALNLVPPPSRPVGRSHKKHAAPITRATPPALWERPSGRDIRLESAATTVAAPAMHARLLICVTQFRFASPDLLAFRTRTARVVYTFNKKAKPICAFPSFATRFACSG